MDRSRPSLFCRGAAAFLACFQTLTLLRPSGRNSGTKVSVGIHTVSVAEKAKYRLVIWYNKRKRCTAWKKVATQDWNFTAEFAECVPEEMRKVRVELQKKKKCKVKTIGVTTVDPTRALRDDRPVKDWYVFDPPKKGRQNRNVSLLEATVAVNGLKVGRTTTQKTGSTKPSVGNGKPHVRPVSSTELKKRDVTAKTTCQAVGAKKLDKTNQGKPPAPSSGDNTHHKPASSSPSAASGSPSSTTTNGAGDVKPSRIHRLFGFITKKNSETTKSADEGGSTKPPEETTGETVVTEDQLQRSSEKEEAKLALKTVSQTVEGEKPNKIGEDKFPVPPSGDDTQRNPASSPPNGSTSPSSTSTTATKTPANGEGDVRPSRIRQLFGIIANKGGRTTKSTQEGGNAEASDVTKEEAVAIEGRLESSGKKESKTVEGGKLDKSDRDKSSSGSSECTLLKPASSSTGPSASSSPATDKSLTNGEGDIKSERPSRFRQLVGFIKKKDNGKTTEGGGKALPTAKPSPPQFTDPRCKEVMFSIHKLWEELLPKRAHSKELLDYANSLMFKMEAAAPQTRDNTILKNLFAKVPDYTHYELPEMQGLSLHELNQIQKTVVFLLEDEEKRTAYFRRWLIDDICRVALEEAPQVLETTAPS